MIKLNIQNLKKYFFLVLFFLLIQICSAHASKLPNDDIPKNINAVKKFINSQKIEKSDLAMLITRMDSLKSDVIFDLNSEKKMTPASISKVITSYSILNHFPLGHKFKTRLFLSEKYKIKDGIYKGDLFLLGGGDPSFVSENMWYLVNIFSRLQINKIEGNIIVDDSLFDPTRFDESRLEKRVDRAYDAPVGAMSFNWNSVNIFIRPSLGAKKPDVFVDPAVDIFEIDNQVKQVSGSENNLSVEKIKNKIFIRGKIGSDSKEIVFFKNIEKPDEWAGENLKLFLKHRGVTVTGKVLNGMLKEKSELVAEYESKPIELILADMNKFSNNFVAEMLTKNLSLLKDKQGTIEGGIKIINDDIKNLNILKDQFEFYNPSGLTRDNKMSVKTMIKVLENIHANFKIFPEFVNSLPIAGVDGTLKKRMKGDVTEGWVRAKTGYLNSVVSLAGYAGRKDGLVYQFAFIYNGNFDESRMRNIFDKVLNLLLE